MNKTVKRLKPRRYPNHFQLAVAARCEMTPAACESQLLQMHLIEVIVHDEPVYVLPT